MEAPPGERPRSLQEGLQFVREAPGDRSATSTSSASVAKDFVAGYCRTYEDPGEGRQRHRVPLLPRGGVHLPSA